MCGNERVEQTRGRRIRRNYCDTDGHYDENDVDKEHEAVHVVVLVVPHRGKHKVHLYENATERQDAPEDDVHDGLQVPLKY